ncbi:MAG: Com family DNA-binding transcriptional regulator [Lachnospiraceae bacterium]
MIAIEKIKCSNCNFTLMLASKVDAEIKCPRCKTVNKVEYNTKGRVQRRTVE